jgi:WD40-like Beta Propeller Repeat
MTHRSLLRTLSATAALCTAACGTAARLDSRPTRVATTAATPVAPGPPVRAELFAPGIVSGPSNDGAPTFSPDGTTLLFSRGGKDWSVILESDVVDGRWGKPFIAAFSGQWLDSQPTFSPDGRCVLFVSHRPISDAPGAPLADNVWRVERRARSWLEAARLPDAVNVNARSNRGLLHPRS